MPPAPNRHGQSAAASITSNYSRASQSVLLLLIGLRIANALTLSTFFQPDEYFQSLEPAWQLAFGDQSGAWITWEWRYQLRSSLHPILFAALYHGTSLLASLCGWSPGFRADVLVAAPKLLQAVVAALGDYCTWRWAERVFGRGSDAARVTLALTVCSPWQWFCSTRTLSNCLETALTVGAQCTWPWQLMTGNPGEKAGNKLDDRSTLRLSLLLAAFACILRPTNILIWTGIAVQTLFYASSRARRVLVEEAILSGTTVLAVSVLSDRSYYGIWTLPPLRFLHFNLAQDLAVFYGRNRPDYYLTEGLPLLLTTYLPFTILGIYRSVIPSPSPSKKSHSQKKSTTQATATATATAPQPSPNSNPILNTLTLTLLFTLLPLSRISHKELRFLSPLLPSLLLLTTPPFLSFLRPSTPTKRTLLSLLLASNFSIAYYVSQVHQRGVVDVVHWLRHEHEHMQRNVVENVKGDEAWETSKNMTLAFLMPCHSTPWRSHLVHPSIEAWALTCNPPVEIPLADRTTYLDEADIFYADAAQWTGENMIDSPLPSSTGDSSIAEGKRVWPDYLVFFEALEGEMVGILGILGEERGYRECWRGFNSHWHDDWRRKGDVVVWCRREVAGEG
ncbi:glycosyltransferase family 22 protein [Aulographum hederae CBS 113979]|uniref:Mannosyltransferase n=1 Tax=Aulographum hederae CBS 113979 TaxID=1176131 RepID=A0A6G1GJS8_9PEZI|nr:glycosyltransferase family 22 protein [Aulographum hederae CBS 113979]